MHGRLHGRAVTGSGNLNSGKCSRYQESGKAHNQLDILVHATILQGFICLRRTDTNCLRDCPLRVSGTRGRIAKSGLIVALVLLPRKCKPQKSGRSRTGNLWLKNNGVKDWLENTRSTVFPPSEKCGVPYSEVLSLGCSYENPRPISCSAAHTQVFGMQPLVNLLHPSPAPKLAATLEEAMGTRSLARHVRTFFPLTLAAVFVSCGGGSPATAPTPTTPPS